MLPKTGLLIAFPFIPVSANNDIHPDKLSKKKTNSEKWKSEEYIGFYTSGKSVTVMIAEDPKK